MHASEFITCLWLLFASQALADPCNSANFTFLSEVSAAGGSQLTVGALSAAQSVTGTSQTSAANTSYVVTGSSTATFSLPSSANLGDLVQISGAGWFASLPNWNWTARASSQSWQAVASSSDGTKLAAVVYGGQIYTSTDSGVTWTAGASSQSWYSIASSSDGTKLATVVNGGQIYVGNTLISGSQGTTATFQYAGNGQWVRMVQAP